MQKVYQLSRPLSTCTCIAGRTVWQRQANREEALPYMEDNEEMKMQAHNTWRKRTAGVPTDGQVKSRFFPVHQLASFKS